MMTPAIYSIRGNRTKDVIAIYQTNYGDPCMVANFFEEVILCTEPQKGCFAEAMIKTSEGWDLSITDEQYYFHRDTLYRYDITEDSEGERTIIAKRNNCLGSWETILEGALWDFVQRFLNDSTFNKAN